MESVNEKMKKRRKSKHNGDEGKVEMEMEKVVK